MKRIVICFSIVLLGSLWSFASELTELQNYYQSRCTRLEVDYSNAVSSGFQSYISSLSALKEEQQSLGNLEVVLAALSEISRAELDMTYPINMVSPHIRELVVVANSVSEQRKIDRAKSLILLASQYNRALGDLKKRLTQLGEFSGASLVQNEQDRLITVANVVEALAVLSAVPNVFPEVAKVPVATPTLKLSDTKKFSLEVEALIDGLSLLHITPSGIYWESLGAMSKPGQPFRGPPPEPTYVNGVPWFPVWGYPNDHRAKDKTVEYPVPSIPQELTFRLLSVSTERGVQQIQQRDPIVFSKNGEEYIVDIPDSQSRARWYRFELKSK